MDGNGGRLSPVDTLLTWCSSWPFVKPCLVVGFSGGRDSHVLLHALKECQSQQNSFTLRAIHINHGLHPDAKSWAQFCQKCCEKYHIPLRIYSLNLQAIAGESLENVARKARYAAFSEALASGEILLTAHHLEDQAETILLQLLRGSGLKGLAGMPGLKPFGLGLHARPLLEVTRVNIENYAKEQHLSWVEDDSNADLRFSRNYIRHRVLNDLAVLNPSYASCLARSGKHCGDAQALLDSYLAEDLAVCETSDQGLLVAKLKQYSLQRQQGIFRLWLLRNGYPLPSTLKLQVILDQMTNAAIDKKPCVEWGQWEARRQKGVVRVGPRKEMLVK